MLCSCQHLQLQAVPDFAGLLADFLWCEDEDEAPQAGKTAETGSVQKGWFTRPGRTAPGSTRNADDGPQRSAAVHRGDEGSKADRSAAHACAQICGPA